MPIVRTYACDACNYFVRVTLTPEQVDDPPPECPTCAARSSQVFSPVAINGSPRARAARLAEEIAATDYNVADMTGVASTTREGDVQKVRYKDSPAGGLRSSNSDVWGASREALESAIASGRETRLKYGSSLDAIKDMPDLIEASKRKSMRIW